MHWLLTTTSYVASLGAIRRCTISKQAQFAVDAFGNERTDSAMCCPLLLIVSALCTGVAGRSMVTKERPAVTSEVQRQTWRKPAAQS